MKSVLGALLITTGCAAGMVQAEPLVNIPEGAVIVCSPTPSIQWLNERVEFKEGKLAAGFLVTCPLPDSKVAPPGSILVAKVIDGPVPNSYAFQWEALRLSNGMTVTWSNAKRDLPSTTQGDNGRLHLTFKRSLVADEAGNIY